MNTLTNQLLIEALDRPKEVDVQESNPTDKLNIIKVIETDINDCLKTHNPDVLKKHLYTLASDYTKASQQATLRQTLGPGPNAVTEKTLWQLVLNDVVIYRRQLTELREKYPSNVALLATDREALENSVVAWLTTQTDAVKLLKLESLEKDTLPLAEAGRFLCSALMHIEQSPEQAPKAYKEYDPTRGVHTLWRPILEVLTGDHMTYDRRVTEIQKLFKAANIYAYLYEAAGIQVSDLRRDTKTKNPVENDEVLDGKTKVYQQLDRLRACFQNAPNVMASDGTDAVKVQNMYTCAYMRPAKSNPQTPVVIAYAMQRSDLKQWMSLFFATAIVHYGCQKQFQIETTMARYGLNSLADRELVKDCQKSYANNGSDSDSSSESQERSQASDDDQLNILDALKQAAQLRIDDKSFGEFTKLLQQAADQKRKEADDLQMAKYHQSQDYHFAQERLPAEITEFQHSDLLMGVPQNHATILNGFAEPAEDGDLPRDDTWYVSDDDIRQTDDYLMKEATRLYKERVRTNEGVLSAILEAVTYADEDAEHPFLKKLGTLGVKKRIKRALKCVAYSFKRATKQKLHVKKPLIM